MEFLKIDPRLDEHPDVLDAGFIGATVFHVVLRLCATFDKRGRLPAKFTPAHIARRLNLRSGDTSLEPTEFVKMGIERCVSVGLLERDGAELVVPGWERFYRPAKTPAERMREYRGRVKGQTSDEDEPEQSDGRYERYERYGTPPTHSTHSTPQDKETNPAAPVDVDPEVPLLTPQDAERTDAAAEVLAHYATAMKANGHEGRATTKRRKLVQARLREGCAVGELKRAIDGLTWSDFHMGRDPSSKGRSYSDLRYALKDRETVDEFVRLAETQGQPKARRF